MKSTVISLAASLLITGSVLVGISSAGLPGPVEQDCIQVGSPPSSSMGVIGCTKLKDSKCVIDVPCKGFHYPGGNYCKVDPITNKLTGSCIHCDSENKGKLCKYTPGSTCKLDDWIVSSTVGCGNETASECRADPTQPLGAHCATNPGGAVGMNNCAKVTQCKL